MTRMALNADTQNVEIGSRTYTQARGYIDVHRDDVKAIRASGVASPAVTGFSEAGDAGWLCCRRVWWSWTRSCPLCGQPRPSEAE